MNELNKNYDKITNLKNAAGLPLVSKYFEQSQVQLKSDTSISPSKFKKHPILLNTYLAHPTTIKALKKDIFTVGEDFEDLENIIECSCCNRQIDAQFWIFCPYCEAQIKL